MTQWRDLVVVVVNASHPIMIKNKVIILKEIYYKRLKKKRKNNGNQIAQNSI